MAQLQFVLRRLFEACTEEDVGASAELICFGSLFLPLHSSDLKLEGEETKICT